MPVCGPVNWVLCGHGGAVYVLTFTALSIGLTVFFLTVGL
ncbi:hypothetical protein LCGC14_2560660 [marine sediment metagenome]|uniref:Uncharacterized protein n=1 Tax=marine sediment metagenome TaxID=412755 RepID=A0A0F9AKP7_9ZZZZ